MTTTLEGAPFTVSDKVGPEEFETLEAALDGLIMRGLERTEALTMCVRLALYTNDMGKVYDWLIMFGLDAKMALCVLARAVSRGKETAA
jgi:hypothetical protein